MEEAGGEGEVNIKYYLISEQTIKMNLMLPLQPPYKEIFCSSYKGFSHLSNLNENYKL